MSLAAVKALTFDVFGTVVDWRGSIIRECTEFGAARGISVVAAHKNDLRATQRVGLRAAFVPRPLEHGPERTVDTTPDPAFDVHASNFVDLAKQLSV